MNEQELKDLIRDAVRRQLASLAAPRALESPSSPHVSHALYLTLVNVGDACLIEPAVTCNHCGYCKSHGH